MQEQIFKTKRIGLAGGRPVGADYMQEIEKKAKRMEDACEGRIKPRDKRQLVIKWK